MCKSHPFLGASPDRVVDNDTLLEVKCPYTARNEVIDQTTIPYLSQGSNGLQLNKTHDYYYQVQGQLLCSDKQKCDFMVYTQKQFIIIPIERDNSFISTMLTSLTNFYDNNFKRALLEKYLYKNSSKFNFTYNV